MTFRTTLRLFVAVLVLGLVVWISRTRIEPPWTGEGERAPLFARTGREVSYLSLEGTNFVAECEKRDGEWWLRRPLVARADEEEVLRILSILESAIRTVTVPETEYRKRELTLADYGLEAPRMRFVVYDGLLQQELLVGRDSPVGDVVYVKLKHNPDIFGTSRDLLAALPSHVEQLRSRKIIEGDATRVYRLEIHRQGEGGFVQLMRAGTEWSIQQPLVAKADGGRIAEMLSALFSLRVVRFVWDPPPAETPSELRFERTGTVLPAESMPSGNVAPDEPTVRISLWLRGVEKRQDLLLEGPAGENSREIFARRGGEASLYTVDRRIFDIFSVTANDLRDRSLFTTAAKDVCWLTLETGAVSLMFKKESARGWEIVSPVKWHADGAVVEELLQRLLRLKIATFVDGVVTNFANFGLQPPALTIRLGTTANVEFGVGTPAEGETLLIGNFRGDSPFVYVKRADRPNVYEVRAESLRWVSDIPADPLRYFDRTILTLPREAVKRISLLKDGVNQTVEIKENKRWVAVEPPLFEPITNAIEEVLFHAANLQAASIEALHPADLSPYGLDKPGAVLTFGLTPEQGIQKSLLIGGRKGDKGVFAMIPGQNLILILKEDVVSSFTRNLTAPVSVPETNKKTTGEQHRTKGE
ncbi:MAG: DUF4340 domain-containing protein [Kiritimatiellia bacterium]